MKLPSSLAGVAPLLALAAPATAQCLSSELVPAASPYRHGMLVACSGDVVLCADNRHDAYFMERDPSGGWNETARFFVGTPDTVPGPAVALDGDTAVVGCAGFREATVYERQGSSWVRGPSLFASDTEPLDEFGWAVELNGDELFVGAPRILIGDGNSSVYAFARTPGGWVERQRIQPTITGAPVGGFGGSIDAEGDTLAIGAYLTPGGGSVFVFERGPGGWTQVDRLHGPPAYDWFGADISLEGDTLLVGAPNVGSAFVFERDESGWTLVQELFAYADVARFGSSVDLRGDLALVGAPGLNGDRGAARLYRRDGPTWTFQGVLPRPTDEEDQAFGGQVALGDGFAYVSAHELGPPGPGSGALYEFALTAPTSPVDCDPTPSSVGAPARLLSIGCPSLQADDLTLVAQPLPRETPAVFFFGPPAPQQPLYDGVLCVGAGFRLAPQSASANGVLALDVDLAGPPGSFLTPGSTWTFQALYRDPGAATGRNLTGAVSLTFEP